MSEQGITRLRAGMDLVQGLIGRFVGGDAELKTAGAGPAAGFDMATFFEGMVPVTHEDIAPPERPKRLSHTLAHSITGMTVMMLMFGLMACSTTLLLERDQGTLRRLLVAAAPRAALLLGKFLFCVVVGVVQLAILFGYGECVFAVGAFRDPVTLAVLSLTWAAAATSFGMLVAVWAKTPKQAEGLSTVLILVMAALGGCWFPLQIAELPLWAEFATHATLTHWAMSGFQALFWRQQAWSDPAVLRAIGVQWGFVVLAAGLTWRLWRRRYLAG
jgi:ABC-type multidrug transport system permease subunit